MTPGAYDWYKSSVKKLFFDTHCPDHVKVGHKFNGEAFAESIKASGFEAVVIHAKCHYGNSYYYTRIGHVHPGLVKDMIGEAAEACRKVGLHFMIYYSTGVDFHAGISHPDWCVLDRRGNTAIYQFRQVCLNTPYTDELLVPQLEELTRGYDIEGIFLDMMTGFGACHCAHCKTLFAKDTGNEIPLDENDEKWPVYARWRLGKAEEFFAKVGKAAHGIKPGLPILGNGLFTAQMPLPVHPDFGAVTIDFTTAGPQPLNGSFEARYAASLQVPSDLFICYTLRGWEDWSRRPVDMVRQDLAAIVGNGARFFLGGRIHPQGTLDQYALNLGREVNDYLEPLIQFVSGAEPVRDIAILNSAESCFGPDFRFLGSGKLGERREPVHGAHRLLCENGRHCVIANKDSLLENLDRYGLVILPTQRHLAPELVVALRTFVENGGALIASYFTACGEEENPRPDTGFFELMGLEYQGFDDLWYGYIGPPDELKPGGEILVHSKFLVVEPRDSEPLAQWIYPYGMEHFRGPFGWGMAPPGEVTKFPAVTIRTLGKGRAAFFACDPFLSHARHQNPALMDLMLHVLDRAYPNPAGKIISGPSRVELSLHKKEDKLLAVLISHHGERKVEHWCIADEIPPVENIRIQVRTPRPPRAVKLMPGGADLRFEFRDGAVCIDLPRLEIFACIEIS